MINRLEPQTATIFELILHAFGLTVCFSGYGQRVSRHLYLRVMATLLLKMSSKELHLVLEAYREAS